MSHFVVGVLVDNIEDAQHEVAAMLGPFDENMAVEPYKRKCRCSYYEAARLADMKTVEEFGKTVDDLRKSFAQIYKPDPSKFTELSEEDAMWARAEAESAAWREYTREYFSFREERLKELEATLGPAADCSDCKGTGTYITTYNPKSKWDWYRIGGRWDGSIKGTPERSEDGFNSGDQYETVVNNSIQVEDYLRQNEPFIPFAVVTPDGEWHERGEMGWWGSVSCEIDHEQWDEAVKAILERYLGYWIVGVDCHI